MLQFIEQHEIKPEIDRMFEAENYADAFNYLEQSKTLERLVSNKSINERPKCQHDSSSY